MNVHPGAGKPADPHRLVDVARLITAYYTERPDPAEPEQRVAFGTSGHRGSAFATSFNEDHILAIAQSICGFRKRSGIDGPMYVGKDTHALSEPAFATALEVLVANDVTVLVDKDGGYTPTPAVSHAILSHNRGRRSGLADGIVITPSHNPPEDGGFKYNPPSGGPADTETTAWIEQEANRALAEGLCKVKRVAYRVARGSSNVHPYDFVASYVGDLSQVVDLESIRAAGLSLGVDPLGGSGVAYWAPIADRYGLDVTVVNDLTDPTFRFVPLDHDGEIRMDCSSAYAMAGLIHLKDKFDVAFGNDTDSDRHGIVTRGAGLLPPNHYLAVAVSYLLQHRPQWPKDLAVGKTLVSSSLIDRVTERAGRKLAEVPVGFKWFVDGLLSGTYGFGGEESAGATFLRFDGGPWTTDKDGIIMDLLAAEITARTNKDPGTLYRELTESLGAPVYARIDTPATREEKAMLAKLSPDDLSTTTLAGERVESVVSKAPANGAPIGGVKVTTANGWFAARPSGTEDVYKIYAESFLGADHLARIQEEAKALVADALTARRKTA